jgi:hypothetical protein
MSELPYRWITGLPKDAQYQLWRNFEALATNLSQINVTGTGRKLVGPQAIPPGSILADVMGGTGVAAPWGTLSDNILIAIEAQVTGIRTGGAAGSTADGYHINRHRLVAKKVAGTLAQVGTRISDAESSSSTAWTSMLSIVSNEIRIRATTPANVDSTWWAVLDYIILDTTGGVVAVTL